MDRIEPTSSGLTDAAIELAPYDPRWPARFDEERVLLQRVLQAWLTGPIEHVGSTAVPGLVAKPIIDVMVPVATLAASRDAIPAAMTAGYVHHPYRADVMHWFCKPSPAHRTHHLHMVPIHSDVWKERLAFRDALRRDPAVAMAYAQLKAELADRFRHDREGYTEAKSSFIRSVLDTAPAHEVR